MFQYKPESIWGQMTALLALSFLLLLGLLAALEIMVQDDVIDTAESDATIQRLRRVVPIVESFDQQELELYFSRISRCHDGYILSDTPYPFSHMTVHTQIISDNIARALNIDPALVQVGFASFDQNDFSYGACDAEEMIFPMAGIVVSLQLDADRWLHTEIHPHEWHLTPAMLKWLLRSGAAFILVGCITLVFVRRLSLPYKALTNAARKFASGLKASELKVSGPSDIRQTILAFNKMQRQVAGEIERRAGTLAAISHDIRSPLTALRVKAELIDDEDVRADLVKSIDRMERTTASALNFLKGEARNEPKRLLEMNELIESECAEFRETGADVSFKCLNPVLYQGRPNALSRAMRNLIENAVKYGGNAEVSLGQTPENIVITVTDTGPGIPADQISRVLEPFERLSPARGDNKGGFGLGLATAKTIIEGHGGKLTLQANEPKGLIVVVILPLQNESNELASP